MGMWGMSVIRVGSRVRRGRFCRRLGRRRGALLVGEEEGEERMGWDWGDLGVGEVGRVGVVGGGCRRGLSILGCCSVGRRMGVELGIVRVMEVVGVKEET